MKKQLWIFLLASALLLSSCGPGQFLGPTMTPTSTLTRTPTVTPTRTITPSPTLTPKPTFTPKPTLTPRPTFYSLSRVCAVPEGTPVIINGYSYLLTYVEEYEERYLIGLLDQPKRTIPYDQTKVEVLLWIKVGDSPNQMRSLPDQYGMGDLKLFTDSGEAIGYGDKVTIMGVNLGHTTELVKKLIRALTLAWIGDEFGCIILVEKVNAGFYNE